MRAWEVGGIILAYAQGACLAGYVTYRLWSDWREDRHGLR